MRILVDTSVLVAATVQAHEHHPPSLRFLQKVHQGKWKAFVATHSLAECYAVLTRLPIKPAIAPLQAQQLIENNFLSVLESIELRLQDYQKVIELMAQSSQRGGMIYDALLIRAAERKKLSHLLTWNQKDFLRLKTAGLKILTPGAI